MYKICSFIALILLSGCVADNARMPQPPYTPELLVDFEASEGITFNAAGELFVAANRGVYRVSPDGSAVRIADTYTNLGLAGYGASDILMADFGPTNIFRDGENDDGIVWQITRDGEKTEFATGIADPNFVVVHADGTFLVSDDGTDKIYKVGTDGRWRIWSQAVPYPNGLVYSLDGRTLYVAQIFSQLGPVVFDNKLWSIDVDEDGRAGAARVVAEVGEGGLDGLALDRLGRVYIAENPAGKIWRFDPASDELIVVAEGVDRAASLVFGEGQFDHKSLFVSTTFNGGGKVWRVPVGIEGAPVERFDKRCTAR